MARCHERLQKLPSFLQQPQQQADDYLSIHSTTFAFKWRVYFIINLEQQQQQHVNAISHSSFKQPIGNMSPVIKKAAGFA